MGREGQSTRKNSSFPEGLVRARTLQTPVCSTGQNVLVCKMGMRMVPTPQGQETGEKEGA